MLNGAHLLFYIAAGLAIWGVYKFETWRQRQDEEASDV